MSWEKLSHELKRPFPVQHLYWRQGRGGTQLVYIDARHVMQRLDQAAGPGNWQDDYKEVGGRLICTISIRCGDEWVSKSDGAGDTNIEGEKGGISDAFKRAAVRWGIGRYLYAMKGSSQNNIPAFAYPENYKEFK